MAQQRQVNFSNPSIGAMANPVFDANMKKENTPRDGLLAHYRGLQGLNQSELARLADTEPGTISKLESGDLKLSDKWKRRLAPHLGVEPWQLTEGAPLVESTVTGKLQTPKKLTNIPSDNIEIPVYDVVVSAGHGKAAFEPQIIDYWSMPKAFFKSMSATAGRNKAFLPVEGDSNAPEYKHGDFVLIDTSQTTPVTGKMFVILNGDLLVLKEIQLKDPHVVLISKNPDYPPLKKRPDDVHIVGQVIRKVIDV